VKKRHDCDGPLFFVFRTLKEQVLSEIQLSLTDVPWAASQLKWIRIQLAIMGKKTDASYQREEGLRISQIVRGYFRIFNKDREIR